MSLNSSCLIKENYLFEYKEMDTSVNMPDIKTFGSVKDLSNSAINTIGLFGHPAWLNVNDCKSFNSLTVSHWVQYNRTKMAMRRITVSDAIKTVRGVIPNSKLAQYGDYSYDLEMEDMYKILEEITETSGNEDLPIPQLKIDEKENNIKPFQKKEQRYTEDFRQWIIKWQKLLGHVRRIINEGKPIDFWTETILKTCLRFLSALRCNPSLMQLMNTETPFITNFHKLHTDPITVEELMSFPQPAIDDNLNLDAAQEDSLWLKLSSPSIRKLWNNEKSDSDKSELTPTMGGTNFLRRQKNTNVKESSDETQISETDARELLGSLIDTMDQQIDEVGERKTSQECVKMMECKRDQAVASNHQERFNELTKVHHVPFPVVARHQMYPPPRPFLLQNMWSWNRYPPKVIQAAAFKNIQFVNGNFIPPCQPYRMEPMPSQTTQPPPPLPYTQQKLLLKSGQMSQTIMEQLRDHFSHQVILQKMQVETPVVATPQYYEQRKKDAKKATMDYAKSCVTNVQLYAHPFIPYPASKQEAAQQSCAAKRVSINSTLMQPLHPQTLQYNNKQQQHVLHQPLNCSKIHGSLPPQYRLQARPSPGELVQAMMENGKTSSNTKPRSALPVLSHHRKKTHVVKVEQAKIKIKKAQAPKYLSEQQNMQLYNESALVKQKHATKSELVECQRLAAFRMNSIPCCNQNIQCKREMMPSLHRDNSRAGIRQAPPVLIKTTEVDEGKSGTTLKLKSHASKMQKKYSRTVYGKTLCKKGNRRLNMMKRKLESDNPLLRYCNWFKENTVLISQIPQEKTKSLYFLEAWLKFSLNRMKENNFKENKKVKRYCKVDTFKISMALSRLLRALKVTPNGTKFISDIGKIVKQLKCFKLEMKKRNFLITKAPKNNKLRKKRNPEKTGDEPSKGSCHLDEKVKYSSREKVTKKFRFINPLHSHFEIKSWSDKKIENQISAHYFHMIADSLLLDNLFKVTTEYGIVNLVNINDESITGWVHFKMALQEVFRNAANHLLNDSLVHAPIQSKLYFNSFLSHIYTNTDFRID